MKREMSINYAGVDVSAKELVVTLERRGHLIDGTACFQNDRTGYKQLAKYLTKHKTKARVCMEATGIYHFELALFLANDSNIDVMVVNPKAIRHFGIASMKRAKNDPVDALTILNYLKCMPFVAWQPPRESCLGLQALSRRLHQLKAELKREQGRRHAGEYSHILANNINNDIDVNIRHIQKRINLMEEKAFELICQDEGLKQQYELLISIKGIAKTAAIQILAEIACLPKDMQASQWVAHAGLDPRVFESGSSINRPRRISKSGNKYLRTALYMPAWVAVQREASVKGFYNKLIEAGKKPLQALVAVMRKLLHAIWGMLKSGCSWQPQKFYQAI